MRIGIHLGHGPLQGEARVDLAMLKSFVRFAKDAAAGAKTMVMTHSAIVPPDYASSAETTRALLGAVGQFLYKSGAARADGTPLSFLLNARLLGGVACYGAVMALFVAAFRRGGELSVLYPLYATTFIWAAAIAF